MYDYTGCDLVMIGRGSYGRPWVFEQVRKYLENGEIMPEPDIETRLAVMKKHCEMLCRYKGEKQGMKEARKNVQWYLKGLRGSAKLRARCGELVELKDLERFAELIRTESEDIGG
jgi:tRNA-dihydrouridine synthase B